MFYNTKCFIRPPNGQKLVLKRLQNFKRGRGYWKFNNELLKENYFVKDMQEFIGDWKMSKPQNELDMFYWWEEGKKKMANMAKMHSRRINRNEKNLLLAFHTITREN
jgi:hypothetical protein